MNMKSVMMVQQNQECVIFHERELMEYILFGLMGIAFILFLNTEAFYLLCQFIELMLTGDK